MLKLDPPSLHPGCLTDLDLDLWVGEELSDARKRAYEAHVSTCDRCTQRLERWRTEAREFHARFPSVPVATHHTAKAPAPKPQHDSEPRSVAKRAPHEHQPVEVSRYLGPVGGLLALAATLILWLGAPSSFVSLDNSTVGDGHTPNEQLPVVDTPNPQGIRTKGASHLDFFVKRGSEVFDGDVGTVVHPADQVRFAVTVDRPQYVTILSLDAKGTVSVYFPASDTAEFVQPAGKVALPSSVLLDTTLGDERVWGVFCARPVSVRRLEADLARNKTLSLPSDCTTDILSWSKELP